MRRVSPITLAALPVALAIVVNWATEAIKIDEPWWPWVVWATVGLLVMASIRVEARRHGAAVPPSLDLGAVADQLADAIGKQWRREEDNRKIHDPVALPLRLRPMPAQLVDHWANIHRAPSGIDPGPIPMSGRLSDIAQIYRRVPSARLVVLGPAGSGKTVLVARLTLDLLTTRQPGHPVPVIVSVATWNPATDFADWLAARLIRDHPGLAPNTAGGRSLASELIDAGLILPILDGFDEIPNQLQRPVLNQLNGRAGMPLVLTSRPAQYAAAVTGIDVLTAAAGIELDELTLPDLAAYLPRTTRRITTDDGHATELWTPVLTHLRDQPHEPAATAVRQTLSTPLMVYLARTIYSDTPEHNPAELLDTARFPTTAAIEQHLIAAYIPAIYQHPRNGRTWHPPETQHWVTHLARHLDRLGTPDLAWWQLRDTIPPATRRLTFGLTLGLVGGLPLGLAGALIFGLAGALTFGLAGGLTLGLAGGLPAGSSRTGPHPARSQLKMRGRLGPVPRLTFRLGLAVAVAVGIVLGVAPPGELPGAFALVLVLGIAFYLAVKLETTIDITAEASPSDSFTNDRANAIRKMLTMGLPIGLSVGFAVGYERGLPIGFVVGLSVGLASGLSLGLASSAWGHWLLLSRIWLPLTGRLPWQVWTFLTDAHHRGILRQTGATYQLRHAILQRYLTAQPLQR